MKKQRLMDEVFGKQRALLGMLHLEALPGTPGGRREVAAIARSAVAEAKILEAAGFDGLLIENMHDRPYLAASVGPEITAAMAVIGAEVRTAIDLPLGVQVLAGANREGLAVALACGAAFVRVEGFVFAHVGDEGLHQAAAGDLLRYRRAIGAEAIRIFADIKKKHSSHALTADVDLEETARAAEFFLADGVIVTGTTTGSPAAAGEVTRVAEGISIPTLVGSGVNALNVASYRAADALIVGSWLKEGGDWTRSVDRRRAEAMVAAFQATETNPATSVIQP